MGLGCCECTAERRILLYGSPDGVAEPGCGPLGLDDFDLPDWGAPCERVYREVFQSTTPDTIVDITSGNLCDVISGGTKIGTVYRAQGILNNPDSPYGSACQLCRYEVTGQFTSGTILVYENLTGYTLPTTLGTPDSYTDLTEAPGVQTVPTPLEADYPDLPYQSLHVWIFNQVYADLTFPIATSSLA